MGGEKWSHKLDYCLTVLGFALGVGTIWKFPYMCARNGGGSFLIPYVLFTLIGSIPLTYLESVVGQMSQLDCFGAWKICPPLQGLAVGSLLISGIFLVYAPVLLAWILYYLYHSFFPSLPWTLCDQPWNTPRCLGTPNRNNISLNAYNLTNSSISYLNTTLYNPSQTGNDMIDGNVTSRVLVPAAEEFFWNNVLQITDSLENMGTLRWPITICLFVINLFIFLCIVKGIRISGKIVYVTVTVPYILVTVILIRACFLPGSLEGIKYYIMPDFARLKDPKIWMEACGLAIYFMGIGFGSLIKMAAHNPTANNCLRDAVTLNLLTTFSLVYFGFSVFAITGHLAHKTGASMDSFSSSGFKLGFMTYPEATALLPFPQLWSVLLFLMLLTLGLDTVIPPAEFVASIVGVMVPRLLRRPWLLYGLVMMAAFLLAVPFTLQGGVYLMTLIEWFTFFPSLAVFALLELVAVAWLYGTPRLNVILKRKQGGRLPRPMVAMLKYVCPALLTGVFGYSFYSYRPPRFEDYVFKPWASVIGWFISMGIVSPVPGYFLWTVWRTPGNTIREKLRNSLKPQGPWCLAREDSPEMEELKAKDGHSS